MIRLLRWFVSVLLRWFPFLSADYRDRRRRRINPRQQCPACGAIERQNVRWDPEQKVVLVVCVVCDAAWGFSPVVRVEKWQKPKTEER